MFRVPRSAFPLRHAPASFDHVFVCFVLEHLAQPLAALGRLKQVLRPGGTLTVIEGDHGSTYFYPESAAAQEAIACLVTLQRACRSGSAERGTRNGRDAVWWPTAPGRRDGQHAVGRPVAFRLRPSAFRVRQALLRTTAADGVFCYTFFKGVATKS